MSAREGEERTKNILKKKPTYHQPNWQQCVTHSGGLPEWAGQTEGRSKTRKQNQVLGHFNVFLRKKNNKSCYSSQQAIYTVGTLVKLTNIYEL